MLSPVPGTEDKVLNKLDKNPPSQLTERERKRRRERGRRGREPNY
jgi:hypothetical protein